MLIGITLTFLMVITLISIVSGNSFIGVFIDATIDNTLIVNGSTTSLEIPVDIVPFGLDPIVGGLALITALAVFGAIITIQVLGSGLSDNGSRIIMVSLFYGGIWTIMSLVSAPLIISIKVFGSLLYLSLTILYAIGVISKYFGKGGDI